MTSVSSPTPSAGTTLDPQTLLEASRGHRLRVRTWPLFVVGMGAMLLWTQPAESAERIVARVLSVLLLVGGYLAISVAGKRIERRLAAEQQAVTALEELVQLRRWPEAADLAGRILGRPMLVPERRVGALLSLATILNRYHRFADARVVHEALLDAGDAGAADPSIAHAVKIARAMTLLRDDLLVDADRAMGDLRRDVTTARDAVRRARGPEAAAEVRSAGLALLDLYRDVKTGHAEEAIAGFERSIAWLPDALGPRVADAWALAAVAYDRLGRVDEARTAFDYATALVPVVELTRRWPETEALTYKYAPITWPT